MAGVVKRSWTARYEPKSDLSGAPQGHYGFQHGGALVSPFAIPHVENNNRDHAGGGYALGRRTGARCGWYSEAWDREFGSRIYAKPSGEQVKVSFDRDCASDAADVTRAYKATPVGPIVQYVRREPAPLGTDALVREHLEHQRRWALWGAWLDASASATTGNNWINDADIYDPLSDGDDQSGDDDEYGGHNGEWNPKNDSDELAHMYSVTDDDDDDETDESNIPDSTDDSNDDRTQADAPFPFAPLSGSVSSFASQGTACSIRACKAARGRGPWRRLCAFDTNAFFFLFFLFPRSCLFSASALSLPPAGSVAAAVLEAAAIGAALSRVRAGNASVPPGTTADEMHTTPRRRRSSKMAWLCRLRPRRLFAAPNNAQTQM